MWRRRMAVRRHERGGFRKKKRGGSGRDTGQKSPLGSGRKKGRGRLGWLGETGWRLGLGEEIGEWAGASQLKPKRMIKKHF